jgi:predicted histone-like DNA-binding protein
MSVKFNVVERGNPANPTAPKKFYPSVVSSGRVSNQELVETAARETALDTADLLAALESFLKIIPREMAKGNIVDLGDFGTFWLRLDTRGEAAADDVAAENITDIKPRFSPGERFKDALSRIKFTKAE